MTVRTVQHAGPPVFGEAVDVGEFIGHATGDDHRPGEDRLAAGELDGQPPVALIDPHHKVGTYTSRPS